MRNSRSPQHLVMSDYYSVLAHIFKRGKVHQNRRTGTKCLTITGEQLEFELQEGFPALTARQIPFKNIRGELLGFFRGYTNAKDFRELGCHFWDKNANETKAWVNSPFRQGEDDLGRIYGAQWTNWESTKIVKYQTQDSNLLDSLQDHGYEVALSGLHREEGAEEGTYAVVLTKHINQLENVVRTILNDPSDRRIIVTGWNPGEIDFQALPACHCMYTFIPDEESRTMDLVMNMRSMDVFLGTPANIVSSAMFLKIVCRLTGYQADRLVIQGANLHLYENSYDVAQEVYERGEVDKIPELWLSDKIKMITDESEIKGCFERIQPEDIELRNYEHQGKLHAEMVA